MDVNYIIAFQNTSKYMVTWMGVYKHTPPQQGAGAELLEAHSWGFHGSTSSVLCSPILTK